MAFSTKTQAGFTLLELIIALTLASLVIMVAYTSTSLSIRAVKGSQAASEKLQELRVCQTILERSLASTVRGSVGVPNYFTGSREEMRFFTALPLEAHNLGGVYHWRILVGEGERGLLLLAVEQTKNVNWKRDPQGVEMRQILLENLTEVHLTYGHGADELESWDAKKARGLPDWVRITVTPKGRPPQSWLIPIHVSEFKSGQQP
jgi:prepilin-type N-terminal cleavage/methylation domain-containing protein